MARTALGTINHSLMTVEALKTRGVPILGIVFNGPPEEESEAIICRIAGVKRLGRLPLLAPLNRETLAETFAKSFDKKDFQ